MRTIESLTQYFVDYNLHDGQFGEMGRRTEILGEWLRLQDELRDSLTREEIEIVSNSTEQLALSLFPFLPNEQPLKSISQNFTPNSKGIVIPVGVKTFRYACHLITTIRDVLHSTLPIQIVYAGRHDLPFQYREYITDLGTHVSTLDIFTLFEDDHIGLGKGSWSIKPFAILASPFQHTLLLDADAVFVQPPDVVFTHPGYLSTGVLLFHDRLLWQHQFADRHAWWEEQLKHRVPSATLNKSLVYMENYAEECDSGAIVVDKGHLSVRLGLLHIAWQNTKGPREKWLEKLTYGDKESWWFGFELVGTPYSFEEHYGSIVGSTFTENLTHPDLSEVCSFVIAHLDHLSKLLWYNGSLLKNKLLYPLEFEVPTHMIVDGEWHKGLRKVDMSCMVGRLSVLNGEEIEILENSVRTAHEIDRRLGMDFPGEWGLSE